MSNDTTLSVPQGGSDGNLFIASVRGLTQLAGLLAAMTLLFMTLIVFYEVVMRSVFNAPTSWVAEISVYSFVAMVFFGMGVAQNEGTPGPDIINILVSINIVDL